MTSEELIQQAKITLEKEGELSSKTNITTEKALKEFILPGLKNSKDVLSSIYSFQSRSRMGIFGKIKTFIQNKINIIKSGRAHFFEVGLDGFVKKGIESGNLIPTISYEESIPNSLMVFSCVGTPDKSDGSLNLDFVFEAAKNVFFYATEDLIF